MVVAMSNFRVSLRQSDLSTMVCIIYCDKCASLLFQMAMSVVVFEFEHCVQSSFSILTIPFPCDLFSGHGMLWIVYWNVHHRFQHRLYQHTMLYSIIHITISVWIFDKTWIRLRSKCVHQYQAVIFRWEVGMGEAHTKKKMMYLLPEIFLILIYRR